MAGGHSWMPMAYDEQRKRVFIPTLNAGMTYGMVPSKEVHFRLGATSGVSGLAMLGGIAMLVATVRLARSLLKPAANDNPLMVRRI